MEPYLLIGIVLGIVFAPRALRRFRRWQVRQIEVSAEPYADHVYLSVTNRGKAAEFRVIMLPAPPYLGGAYHLGWDDYGADCSVLDPGQTGVLTVVDRMTHHEGDEVSFSTPYVGGSVEWSPHLWNQEFSIPLRVVRDRRRDITGRVILLPVLRSRSLEARFEAD